LASLAEDPLDEVLPAASDDEDVPLPVDEDEPLSVASFDPDAASFDPDAASFDPDAASSDPDAAPSDLSPDDVDTADRLRSLRVSVT
jgi:hypothetical protein